MCSFLSSSNDPRATTSRNGCSRRGRSIVSTKTPTRNCALFVLFLLQSHVLLSKQRTTSAQPFVVTAWVITPPSTTITKSSSLSTTTKLYHSLVVSPPTSSYSFLNSNYYHRFHTTSNTNHDRIGGGGISRTSLGVVGSTAGGGRSNPMSGSSITTRISPRLPRRGPIYTSTTRSTIASSRTSSSTTTLHAVLMTSLIAGSIAGAVGVGVAYPLDTLKTKQQVMNKNNNDNNKKSGGDDSIILLLKEIYKNEGIGGFYSGVRFTMMGQAVLKGAAFTINAVALQSLHEQYTGGFVMTETECLIMAACLSGFLTSFIVVPIERIKVIMQAQLSPYQNDQRIQQQMERQLQQQNYLFEQHDDSLSQFSDTRLTMSSGAGAYATSALSATRKRSTSLSATSNYAASGVPPLELVEDRTMYYPTEMDCLRHIIQNDGIQGLLLRGITPTIAREVPRYAIYFVVYGLLMQQMTNLSDPLGQFSPLFCGALAGCISWLPVYPTDVVKTMVQNTPGGNNSNNNGDSAGSVQSNSWQIGKDMYDTGGWGAFYDGLTPKLLRAAIINAVTFFMYDSVVDLLSKSDLLQ